MNLSLARTFWAAVASLTVAAGALTTVVATAPTAGALQQITVINNDDDGAGSLRAAFIAANSVDDDVEIIIPASVGDITLTTGELLYSGGVGNDQTLTLTGGGNTITQTTVGARVINDTALTLFTMSGLTITGGNLGAATGGGIGVAGSATIRSSTISGNSAGNSAAGIHVGNGPLLLVDSTISGNTAADDGGGAAFVNGTATIVNSTITGNSAGNTGGGIDVLGDAVLVYATIVENTAAVGANVFQGAGRLWSFASVVALPLGDGASCTVPATTSSGYNWDDDGSCGFGAGPGDHSDAGDPELGALADNGGPTQTRAPAETSGLVDDIPGDACGDGDVLAGFAVTTDQRDEPRPDPVNGLCDIGAVELQPIPPDPPVPPEPPVPPSPIVLDPRFTG